MPNYALIKNQTVENITVIEDPEVVLELKQSYDDVIELDNTVHADIGFQYLNGLFVAPIPVFAPMTTADLSIIAQRLLDNTAVEHGYDNILSACLYAIVDGPYQAEGAKFATWRSQVWEAVFKFELTDTTTEASFLATLPKITI